MTIQPFPILILFTLTIITISLTHQVSLSSIHQQQQIPSWTAPNTWSISQSQTNYQNITNLNAPNWIVGNQTIDDYNKDLYNFITKNNVTKCPIDTPYWKATESKCVQCKDPNPVFDLYLKDCTSCPEGTKFNPNTHKCEKVAAPQPPTNKCSANYIWSDSLNKCVCPDSSPIDLGCECVKCLEPFVWNSVERTCKLRCDETHVWNKDTQKCECPKSTPYEVNGECIACEGPFEWKGETNTCQLKVSNCAVSTPATPTTAPTTPTTTPTTPTTTPTTPVTQTCNSNYVWDNVVNQCVCPKTLPFNDGTKCVQCDLPKYWDHNLRQCLNCLQRQYFNSLERKCQACPSAKPLWRNFSCEACPNGTTYNQTSNTCDNQDSFIDPAVVPATTTTTTTTQPVA